MDPFDRRFHRYHRRSNDDADNTGERQNPEDPADCLCETCQIQHRLRNPYRMASLAHELNQSLNILDRERPSISVTPRRPAGPRPSRSLPLLAPRPTRDPDTHSILDQSDTTTGSELDRALTLGSQSRLPDIQQYAELGAQNEHAQAGSSRPAPNRLPAILPNYPREYPPPPYATQERDDRNRHIPSSRPTPRYHDQRRYSQLGGENANLRHRGVRPAPTELPPAIPRQFVSNCINNFHGPLRPSSPAPTGFPPAIPQRSVSGGQSNFYMPTRPSFAPTEFPLAIPQYPGLGGQNNLHIPARPSPTPTGFLPSATGLLPAIPQYAGSGGQNNFYVPTRPPPVLQQHGGNDGRSGFAQIGYSTAIQSSLTTEVQANRGNTVTQNEEKDDFVIDSEEE
ncbi:hypothetical protein BKA59DRAFT_480934 [Fusarium tricinctum]|uniref:Uncharacterized protein n=1 Tax=Fusarium tricinctum TaxID=61284 RepID=A0A8K0RWQ2_9HYPO|nr:hypothetical protein BKA59DRAFT_480934 [Fusarium tricinctum]